MSTNVSVLQVRGVALTVLDLIDRLTPFYFPDIKDRLIAPLVLPCRLLLRREYVRFGSPPHEPSGTSNREPPTFVALTDRGRRLLERARRAGAIPFPTPALVVALHENEENEARFKLLIDRAKVTASVRATEELMNREQRLAAAVLSGREDWERLIEWRSYVRF